jgi:predicted kinase
MSAGKEGQGRPILIRLAGQSGSGKSTQLFPAAAAALEGIGVNATQIAVRKFVPYCPWLEEIRAAYGEENLRENTNAFALTLLFFTLEKLMRAGIPVVMEVNLLDPAFEEYIAILLKENGYNTECHVMAVAREISDEFIKRRCTLSKTEGGRIVSQASSDYFYNSVPIAIKRLAEVAPETPCVLWSAFDRDPIFDGKIGSPSALQILSDYRKISGMPIDSPAEAELLDAKKKWFSTRHASSVITA